MMTICPTCRGKGAIDDPKAPPVLGYAGPNGERCPQVHCQSCSGSGWVWSEEKASAPPPANIEPEPYIRPITPAIWPTWEDQNRYTVCFSGQKRL